MLVGVVMLGCALMSCSKDDYNDGKGNTTQTKNPLVGTMWVEDGSSPIRLEFTGQNTVTIMAPYQGVDDGTYTISGNTVTFVGLATDNGYYQYTSATFTNNTMVLTLKIGDLTNVYKRYLYKQ